MLIQISIPRPVLTIVGILAVGAAITTTLPQPPAQADVVEARETQDAVGGTNAAADIINARDVVERQRAQHEVLTHEEDIWRYQVEALSTQVEAGALPQTADDLKQSRAILLSILKQKQQAETLLTQSLNALLDVEGTTVADSADGPASPFAFSVWPVRPAYGISAYFEDPTYRDRFHVDHHAVDIPVEQGTRIVAPADGVVQRYADNGLGYSFLVLDHGDGIQTIYGHISAALVQEGQHVTAGQAIATSGGRIGSKGAGALTTGPHLHFAMKVNGKLTDPLPYLASAANGRILQQQAGNAQGGQFANTTKKGDASWTYAWR